MQVDLKPGTYIVAVSGGVDSMALLDALTSQQTPGVRLIVAHFDHGIRHDSALDRELVQATAAQNALQFVYDEGRLPPDASEDMARRARYDFLHQIRKVSGARAIITAHHQDDLVETAIHNLLRGTNRSGVVSLRSRPGLLRPLLQYPKSEILAYASQKGLNWREDSTNQELRYRRNYIRHKIAPRLSEASRQDFLNHIHNIHKSHEEIEKHLINYLHMQPATHMLARHQFIMLPHSVAREVMTTWLKLRGAKNSAAKLIDQLVTDAKTARVDRQFDVDRFRP